MDCTDISVDMEWETFPRLRLRLDCIQNEWEDNIYVFLLSSANPGFALKILEILIIKDDVCLCVNRGQMKKYKSFRF